MSGALLGSVAVPFATMDVDGRPGFEFWLEASQTPCAQGQEFCVNALVKGGKLRGNSTPFTNPDDPSAQSAVGFSVRFEIDLTGELDCRTGVFKGRLENGCYDVFSVLYRFSGAIESKYSLGTSAFVEGSWNVEEMQMPNAPAPSSPLTGAGSWTAAYKDDVAPPRGQGQGIGLCAGQSGLETQP